MKTFIISYVSEQGSLVKIKKEAQSMSLAIRAFLIGRESIGLNNSVCFSIIKLQVN